MLTLDVYWDSTCLDSLGGVDNEIWNDAQSSKPKGPSDSIFNEHGEFRGIEKQEMHFFDSLKCDSCEDMNTLIASCVQCHNDNPRNNHIVENVYYCDSFFIF